MVLNKLELTNYRNFTQAAFEFHPNLTLFVGPNGVGKTNILEAIFYLSTLRSFRRSRNQEVVQLGKNFARIVAELRGDSQTPVALALTPEGKIGWFRDKKIPLAKLVGIVKSVVFLPDSLQLVTGPPVLRRRELDLLLTQISSRYLYYLLQYQKVIRQRNALLAQGEAGKEQLAQLEFWDKHLVEIGKEIVKRRKIALEFLNRQIGELFAQLTGYRQRLTLSYSPSVAPEVFEKEVLKNRQLDLKYKQTTLGPHRDNWQFRLGGKDLAHFGSRGEIRSATLAFKIACTRLLGKDSNPPILLLDDVLSELDLQKTRVLKELINLQQTIVTATDAERIPKNLLEKAKVFRL